MVDVATRLMARDKPRFAATVLGVAFAVALVLIQMGLFRGILQNASISVEKARADLWVTSRNTANVDYGQPFPASYVNRVRSTPGVLRADNLIVWIVRVGLPSGSTELAIAYGLEDFLRWGLPWSLSEGGVEDLRRGNNAVLDESAQTRFGAFNVGDHREFQGRRLKIVGKARGALSFTTTPVAFIDYHLLQSLDPMNLSGRTTYILVRLEPGADPSAVRAEIQRRLPHNDVYLSHEWAERSRAYWLDTTGLGLNMFVTVFLGCLVGVVVVAQTLFTSTMSHQREFAVVKAIGGGNAEIYGIIVRQATLAALLGFSLGGLATLAARPMVSDLGLKMILDGQFLAVVLAGTVGLCLLASSVSYRRISRLDPAVAFRA
ncbi:MAG: ABC transporter permease [Verrucomicrobiales bacterium]|nr:ABC transporter permease [Verrucomicrobiales bacterium]MCP5526391.1 ABC transporter permease [Verrucomicrobiales bacterium]